MYELVRVGHDELVGEIIKLEGGKFLVFSFGERKTYINHPVDIALADVCTFLRRNGHHSGL